MKNRVSSSIKLASIFLFFGVAWIVFSDLISLTITNNDLQQYNMLQHSKGILFMVMAAVLIYFVSRKLYADIEKANREQAAEQERHKNEMAQNILQAEESERKKLGEELHDNINQLLGVVKLYVQHAQVNPGMRQELLVKCSDYIGQTIEEIRHLSRSLLPPALNEHGFLNSLYQLIADIRQAKEINIEVNSDEFLEERLPADRQLMIYRIIQEQLNNVLKHSGADHVYIDLKHTGNLVQFSIRDNGTGFDTEKNKPGMGLMNIRSRLMVANGSMEINSAPGKGCELFVEFKH